MYNLITRLYIRYKKAKTSIATVAHELSATPEGKFKS